MFIQVYASKQSIHERLVKRGDQVSPDYAAKIALNFEKPKIKHVTLLNERDDAYILQQAYTIFSR